MTPPALSTDALTSPSFCLVSVSPSTFTCAIKLEAVILMAYSLTTRYY